MKEVLEFEEKEILKCSSRFTSSIYHVRSVIQNITFHGKSMLDICMKQILLSPGMYSSGRETQFSLYKDHPSQLNKIF